MAKRPQKRPAKYRKGRAEIVISPSAELSSRWEWRLYMLDKNDKIVWWVTHHTHFHSAGEAEASAREFCRAIKRLSMWVVPNVIAKRTSLPVEE